MLCHGARFISCITRLVRMGDKKLYFYDSALSVDIKKIKRVILGEL